MMTKISTLLFFLAVSTVLVAQSNQSPQNLNNSNKKEVSKTTQTDINRRKMTPSKSESLQNQNSKLTKEEKIAQIEGKISVLKANTDYVDTDKINLLTNELNELKK